MRRTTAMLPVVLAGWFVAPFAPAGECLTIDFEQGDALAKYERLQCAQGEAAVVPTEIDQASGAFTIPCKEAALRGRFLAPAGVGLKVTKGFPVEPVDGYSTRPKRSPHLAVNRLPPDAAAWPLRSELPGLSPPR